MVNCITPAKTLELQRMLEASNRAAVAVHNHPDGDAIGSGLAFKHFYESMPGKQAALIIPDAAPSILQFLTDGEDITDASLEPEKARGILQSCDLLVILDMNAFSRADDLEGPLRDCPAPRLLVDHHLNPDLSNFDLAFSQNDISSASELLFWVLSSLPDGMQAIPKRSLECIFTGMTTDTNNFANSVYDSTLQMTAALLEAGVDRQKTIEQIYQSDRPERLYAIADLISRHMKVRNGIATIVLSREMTEEYGLLEGETEGLVNIPLRRKDVKMSVFLRSAGNLPEFRVSIRSKQGWSANELAVKYFEGGGHERAAGGRLRTGSAEEAEKYLADISAARLVQK